MAISSRKDSLVSNERAKLLRTTSGMSYKSTTSLITSYDVTPTDLTDGLTAEDYLERPETRAEFRRRMISLTVAMAVLVLIVVQSTMYWTSLWPYLQTIDPGADESFFGWVLMAYNLAGALASPLFGLWTNRMHGSKVPIMAGLVLNTSGNILLAFVESFAPTSRKWVIMVARIISGLGAGNRGALFAYTVMASKESERNLVISIRGAITSGAIMLGPGIQSALVPIGYPGFVRGEFRLSMYTAPAYLSFFLGAASLVIMFFCFIENWSSVAEKKNADGQYEELEMRPYDTTVLLVCGFSRFAQIFCFAFDDTVGSPLTMIMFKWTKSEAILYNGIITVVIGFIDVFAQLFVGNIVLRWVRERTLILFGLSMMLGFLIVVFPWPGLPPLLNAEQVAALQAGGGNVTSGVTSSLLPLSGNNLSSLATTTLNPGMECTYPWCAYTTRINLAQYLVAFAFLLGSISTAYTPAATLFSKALGPRRQGTWQGFFSACGLMGMTLSPPISSNLFQYAGPRVMWAVGFGLIIVAIIPFIVTFKRLVPWSETKPIDKNAKENGSEL